MKKFMSMLMLVLLTITLSACERKEATRVADFTFEVNNFVNIHKDQDKDIELQDVEITADINIINNTKYYVTNYPVVYWLVDANGETTGKDSYFNVGTINLGPKGEVNVPISFYFSNVYCRDEEEYTAKLNSFVSATDIKISPLTYEMVKPIGNIEAEETRDFKEFTGMEVDFTDGLINMSQETFDNTLSKHLSKEPKHIGGAPTIFYEPSKTPITPTIQANKDEKKINSVYDNVIISAEFTNDTDYLIDGKTIDAILEVKEGDKVIKREYLFNVTSEGCEYIKPGTTTTLSVESLGYKIGEEDVSNKINKYTYQLIFIPTISLKGVL